MDYSTYGITASELERAIDTSDPSVVGALSATLGAFFGVFIAIALVLAVLQIIAMWKIFSKAGQKGWKSIIPIYNLVILFRIIGISPWLILAYLTAFIPFVGWIVILVLTIYQANCLAKSFGKDIGYTIGLVIPATSWIFYLILGLGSAEYVGPSGNAGSNA